MALKLTFFPVPGLAEATRIAAKVGGVDMEDVRVTPDEWAALKSKTKKGSLPFLSVGGTEITQAFSILRYVGKLGKLYPEDPLLAALVDEKMYELEEYGFNPALPTFSIKDSKEKETARKALIAEDGKIAAFLRRVDDYLALSVSGFMVGDAMTILDIQHFARLGFLFDGPWLEHIGDQGILKKYKHIQKHRKMMMETPAIRDMYEGNEDPMRNCYTMNSL